jgi:AspT/YidE/YbjL antiporter-like protein
VGSQPGGRGEVILRRVPHLTPLVALFLVASIGFLIGRIEVRGVALGVAAVLFAGLALSAAVPDVALPEIVPQLGLALFLYAIGVASGPAFFAMFRARGVRDTALTVGALTAAALLTVSLARALGLSGPSTTGIFCGALTSTPALAAAVQSLARLGGDTDAPVVAYSVAYPLGVLGLLAAMLVAERFFRNDARAERTSQVGASLIGQHLETITVRVGESAAGRTPGELRREVALRVAFGAPATRRRAACPRRERAPRHWRSRLHRGGLPASYVGRSNSSAPPAPSTSSSTAKCSTSAASSSPETTSWSAHSRTSTCSSASARR